MCGACTLIHHLPKSCKLCILVRRRLNETVLKDLICLPYLVSFEGRQQVTGNLFYFGQIWLLSIEETELWLQLHHVKVCRLLRLVRMQAGRPPHPLAG